MENKKRKLCRSCKYSNSPNLWTASGRCNYICVTGHMRGCPASDCDKYERGKRLPSMLEKSIVVNNNQRNKSLRGKGPLTEEERAERAKKKKERQREYSKRYRQEHAEEIKKQQHEKYKNMTEEERLARNAYQREYKRKRKAEKNKAKTNGVDGNPMEVPRKVEE